MFLHAATAPEVRRQQELEQWCQAGALAGGDHEWSPNKAVQPTGLSFQLRITEERPLQGSLAWKRRKYTGETQTRAKRSEQAAEAAAARSAPLNFSEQRKKGKKGTAFNMQYGGSLPVWERAVQRSGQICVTVSFYSWGGEQTPGLLDLLETVEPKRLSQVHPCKTSSVGPSKHRQMSLSQLGEAQSLLMEMAPSTENAGPPFSIHLYVLPFLSSSATHALKLLRTWAI